MPNRLRPCPAGFASHVPPRCDGRRRRVQVIVASNEPVRLSFLMCLLRDFGFDPVLYDGHMAAVEGSIGAIMRRIAVPAAQAEAARRALKDADMLD
jgi:hypothetical protein